MPESFSITICVHKGDVLRHWDHEIEVVGHEVNDPSAPVVRVVGTDRFFVLEGAKYEEIW